MWQVTLLPNLLPKAPDLIRTRRAKTLVPSNTRGRKLVRGVDGLEQKRWVDRHLWRDCGQKLGEGGNSELAA